MSYCKLVSEEYRGILPLKKNWAFVFLCVGIALEFKDLTHFWIAFHYIYIDNLAYKVILSVNVQFKTWITRW